MKGVLHVLHMIHSTELEKYLDLAGRFYPPGL